jgi:hypothetical protein
MRPKIYNFPKKTRLIYHEAIGGYANCADYFDFYHTGIENLVTERPDLFSITDRYEGEKPEQLTWDIFGDVTVFDILLACNNETMLWNSPFFYDTTEKVIDNKMEYYKKIHKVDFDETQDRYQYLFEIFKNDVEIENDSLRKIIIPKLDRMGDVIRIMRNYIKKRILV